jgi:hypothetical protein
MRTCSARVLEDVLLSDREAATAGAATRGGFWSVKKLAEDAVVTRICAAPVRLGDRMPGLDSM